MPNDDDFDFDFDLGSMAGAPAEAERPVAVVPTAGPGVGPGVGDDDEEDWTPGSFMAGTGLKKESQLKDDLAKPWMKYHHFHLVKTVDEVKKIVDKAIKHGRCALDLETGGFDNRIDWIDGKPVTRHKIVGFCISVKGVGYYIPLRHNYDPVYGQKNPNVTPIRGVEAEISRLCHAAQPELTEEGLAEDPLGSFKIKTPPKVVIYFWHSKFDQEFLFPLCLIDYWHPLSFEDGLLAAYVVLSEDKRLKLKEKSSQRLFLWIEDDQGNHIRVPYDMIKFAELFPKGMKASERQFADLYPEDGSAETLYGCSDAICTELLCEYRKTIIDWKRKPAKFKHFNTVGKALEKRFSGTYRLEKQTVQAVRVMERTRTLIEKTEIDKLIVMANTEMDRFDEQIKVMAKAKGFHNFNPSSPAQISDFLFTERGLNLPKPEMTSTPGQYKTDADTLEKLVEETGIETLKLFVKRRQVEKIKGTYLLSIGNNTDEHNQLRFAFKQTGAATGRFSAPAGKPDHGFAGVPIQGIPARYDPDKPEVANSLRRIFISHPGYTFCKVDYAGQELRIVTNLSKEPVWMTEFLEGTGDLHTITAQAFFGSHITKANKLERGMGKTANFAMIYGGGTQAVMRATKCDKMEAARRKANFDKSVPTFARWVQHQHGAVKRLRGVTTAFRRFISIPDANIKVGMTTSRGQLITEEREARRIRGGCERKSTNYPIQGSGADILKIVLVMLTKELTKRGWLKNGGDDSVRMLMVVHDEIDFEIRDDRLQEALEVICKIMQAPGDMVGWTVPLIVEPEIGKSWEAKHDFRAIMNSDPKHPVPDWLTDHVKPDPEWCTRVDTRSLPGKKAAAPKPAAPVEEPTEATEEVIEATKEATGPVVDESAFEGVEVDPEEEKTPPTTPSPVSEVKDSTRLEVATFTLSWDFLSRTSISAVMEAVGGSLPQVHEQQDAKILRLLDLQGVLLIDTKLAIRIIPDRLSRKLRDRGMGHGRFDLTPE